ncbi:MAG: caspase family protein, partial [Spirochaetales bacterium]|nr:caspase family protein [Spirochaetales bacterium]
MKRTAVLPVVGTLLGLAVLLAALLLSACRLDMSYDKYAVVFGVADYQGTGNDLSWTVADADAMAALLAAQGFVVYERINADATRAELESLLGTVAAAATEDDLFVFYYSGHGGQAYPPSGQSNETSHGADDPDEWIFLYGSLIYTDPDYVLDLTETYSDDGLAKALEVLPTTKKIVIIDACNSGGFIADQADVDGVPADYTGTIYLSLGSLDSALSAYFDPSADSDITPGEAIVLAAAGEQEFSYETLTYQHGVFTYFLLQAPSAGDSNEDGYVTVTEAYDYTRAM